MSRTPSGVSTKNNGVTVQALHIQCNIGVGGTISDVNYGQYHTFKWLNLYTMCWCQLLSLLPYLLAPTWTSLCSTKKKCVHTILKRKTLLYRCMGDYMLLSWPLILCYSVIMKFRAWQNKHLPLPPPVADLTIPSNTFLAKLSSISRKPLLDESMMIVKLRPRGQTISISNKGGVCSPNAFVLSPNMVVCFPNVMFSHRTGCLVTERGCLLTEQDVW